VVPERAGRLAPHPALADAHHQRGRVLLSRGIVLFEREFIEAQQAAYVETALEDYEICQRLDRGRRSLYEAGQDDAGPYQSPMEDPEVHFHEYLHRKLGR
jgi:hypothetical protein